MRENKIEEIFDDEDMEILLLLEAIYSRYGYDFRDYSRAHMKRRILRRISISGLHSILQMQHKVLSDSGFFKTVLSDFSINVTEMFRDPSFYKAFRKEVIPMLKAYPSINVWHAGCSTGEEVYSMAIVLKEEGLYDRSQIYATDFNEIVLQKAKEGIYPMSIMKEYACKYQQAGGKASFADYYVNRHDSAILDQSLKTKIVFASHNLVTDGVFDEMHVIFCRNVLIYFNRELQGRVLKLFCDSLGRECFLCLGAKESIKFSNCADYFEPFVESEKIFRKRF